MPIDPIDQPLEAYRIMEAWFKRHPDTVRSIHEASKEASRDTGLPLDYCYVWLRGEVPWKTPTQ